MLALAGLCIVSYLPFITGGLLTDDFVHFTRLLSRPNAASVLFAPDAFHFYRPVPQMSLWLHTRIFGVNPFSFRLVNLALHVAVVMSAFGLSQLIVGRGRSAALAALAFALTPKAHPIAVLWISARSELLMALFSILAVICWIRWDQSTEPSAGWLAASGTCSVIALLSKETAVFLPLLLLFTPSADGSLRPTLRRWRGVLLFALLTGMILLLRQHVGAAMPTTLDPHYGLIRPFGRWVRSVEVYGPRALPSALALVTIVGGPPLLLDSDTRGRLHSDGRRLKNLALFAAIWFVTFILPVLPIPSRSELYLYLPGFGGCLLAGALVDTILGRGRWPAAAGALLVTYVLLLGGYQISRGLFMHRDLQFSADLTTGLRSTLESYTGPVALVPADPATSQLLRDSIGGYADLLLKMATERYEVNGFIQYARDPIPEGVLKIACEYRNRRVLLSRM